MTRFVSTLLATVLALFFTQPATAQSHFTDCTTISSSSATLIVPSTADLATGPDAIASGDEIALFTPEGHCAGVGVWDGANLAVTLWADNGQTADKDGFAAGDSLHYRVWDASAATERGGDDTITVQYDDSQSYYRTDGLFSVGAFYALSSLQVNTPPASPTLLEPADQATGASQTPTLVWSSVTNASSYRLQVATTTDFSAPLVDQTSADTSATLNELSAETTYYWRVQTTGTNGLTGDFSVAFSFTTEAAAQPPNPPELLEPSNQATGVTLTPTLLWGAVTDADSYRLQVATTSDFTNPLVDQTSTDTTATLNELADETTYYWRVQTTGTNGLTGDFSAAFSFTTQATIQPLEPPTLLTPTDGTTNLSTEPTLMWTSVAEATSYEVEVAPTADFTTIAAASTLADTTATLSGLDYGTTYYWHVRALGSDTSDFSAAFSFTTVARPAPPQLLQPTDDATGVTLTPTLAWSGVAEAASYRLQVATSTDFSSPLVDQTGADTSAALSDLSTETTYYWRVQSIRESGLSGDFSAPFAFTTEAPAPPPDDGLLISPADGATGISPSVTFEWKSVASAQRYNIEVSTRSNFASLAVKKNSLTDTQYGPVSLQANTTYYWRIEARGRRGFREMSEVQTFTTGGATANGALADGTQIPDEIALLGNYPNPVHDQTTITVALPEQTSVRLTVYDVLGREVKRLVHRPLSAGYHSIQWRPRGLPSGQYVYRLRAGDRTMSRLLTLVR